MGNTTFAGVVKSNGTISMWGYNLYGQLGDGGTTNRSSPVLSGTSTQWKMLSIGNTHTLAIRNDGTLWAWGQGTNARLGQGTDTGHKYTPTQVGTATNWAFCSAGETHSMAIDSTGTLYGFGSNTNYRAGLSAVSDYNAPSRVSTVGEWKTVSAGVTHSIGIKQNGTMWGWGYGGTFGLVGTGNVTSNITTPTVLDIGSVGWKQVSSSTFHNLAVKDDGSLWSWGSGSNGKLGHGNETTMYAPTRVGNLNTWAYASTGETHSMAIRFDGTLWAWGENTYGQLGNGTTTKSLVPVQVGTETTWKQVFAGSNFTIGLKKDGTIWSWGDGNIGRLGNGATSGTVLTPTQIGATTNNVRLGSGEEHTWVYPDGIVAWDASLSTSGNGGRKLIRLNDNSLVSVTKTTSTYYLHKSTDGGKKWFKLNQYTMFDLVDVALTTNGTTIYVGVTHGLTSVANGRYVSYQSYNSNGSMILGGTVDSGQSAVGNISLAMNKAGTEVHMAWSSKNPTYPNSLNIRYAKGAINADKSVVWGALEQVVTFFSGGNDCKNPSITISNNAVVITYERYNVSSNMYVIDSARYSGSSWSFINVYNGGAHVQSSPSAVVDKDGVIHVAWDGTDATHSSKQNIRYAKSTDGGVTWSTPVKLTSGNSYAKVAPSIAVDMNGKVAVLYYGTDASSLANVFGVVTTASGGWSEDTKLTEASTVASSNGLPSVMYDHSISGSFDGIPPTIYYATNMIKYMGTYVTNKAPTMSFLIETESVIYKGGAISFKGSVRDADVGNVLSVKYQINNSVPRAIASGISDGSTWIPYSRSLTLTGDKIYDGDVVVYDGLVEGTTYTISCWVEDDKGGKSTVQTYDFSVILNILPTITMVSSVYPDMKWTMADSDGSIVRTSFAINGAKAYEATFPTGTQTYTLTPGKLSIGSNSVVIEAEDDAGAIKRRTFNVVLARTRIPETQLTANLEAESMAEVRLRMERTDALENIKLTRIIGGIS